MLVTNCFELINVFSWIFSANLTDDSKFSISMLNYILTLMSGSQPQNSAKKLPKPPGLLTFVIFRKTLWMMFSPRIQGQFKVRNSTYKSVRGAPVQDGRGGDSWTHLLPQTQWKGSYIWYSFLWRKHKNWHCNSFVSVNKRRPALKQMVTLRTGEVKLVLEATPWMQAPWEQSLFYIPLYPQGLQ